MKVKFLTAVFFGMVSAFCGAETLWPGMTFQELMDPAVFPDAQRGMVVESVAGGGRAGHHHHHWRGGSD